MTEQYGEHNAFLRKLNFVYDAHAGQVDKQGRPYHEHLDQVAGTVSYHLYIPALAHDILEDTDVTETQLYAVGFSPQDVNLIKLLTKYPNMTRREYLTRVASNKDAVRIRIADVVSNLSRIATIEDEKTRIRLRNKYYDTLTLLAGVST